MVDLSENLGVEGGVPSFNRQVMEMRAAHKKRAGGEYRDSFRSKLRNYEFAASHGVVVPEVVGCWANPADIDFDVLPSKCVLKSDMGHSGNGVLLLELVGDYRYSLIGSDRVYSRADIIQFFKKKAALKLSSGVIFAEAYLTPGANDSSEIPDDIKIYTCYGRVLQVLIRSAERLRDPGAVTWKYFDSEGSALSLDVPGRPIGDHLSRPEGWGDLMKVSEHLSWASGVPFMRVDLFKQDETIVLGEMTPSPGGAQEYEPGHDEFMGNAWLEGVERLRLDIDSGRPPGIILGSHGYHDHFPDGERPNDEWDEVKFVEADCRYCS